MSLKNYYDILGVPQDSSLEDIKRAYRKLSLKFHPDKNEGDAFLESMFRSINEANQTLTDPVKRADYDSKLNRELQGNKVQRTSEIQPSDELKVIESISAYFRAKANTADKETKLYNTKLITVPRYLSFSNLAITVVAMIIFNWALKPAEAVAPVSKIDSSAYQWSTTEAINIYIEPNINSQVIGSAPANKGYLSLKETNYFIRVSFLDKSGNKSYGYIRKKQLKKNY